MVTMIGPNYWSTGIVVLFAPPALWDSEERPRYNARLKFFDDGFAQESSTEGELRVRYYEPDLATVLDVLIADANRLGIELKAHKRTPFLYVENDGENSDVFLPSDWKAQLHIQATRLGWNTYER